MTKKPTPYAQPAMFSDPDLVDRIFDYIVAEFPEIKQEQVQKLKTEARHELGGRQHYVPVKPASEREMRVASVLALFNGRNATEVARRLQISRATVYRIIKQPGGIKNCLSFTKT